MEEVFSGNRGIVYFMDTKLFLFDFGNHGVGWFGISEEMFSFFLVIVE